MIKAIIFDFGGVIVRDRALEYYQAHSKEISPESLQKYLTIEDGADLGHVQRDEFFRVFNECFGSGEAEKLYADECVLYATPDQNVLAVIRSLKEKYKIGYLSNNYSFWAVEAKRMPYMSLFDAVVISCEVGMEKPDPKIYLLTAEKLGVEPFECIFVDNTQVNVEGARKLLMKGIKFENVDQLKKDLEYYGVKA